MRILNLDDDKSINQVCLYLLESEAKELMDSLKEVLEKPDGYHAHVASGDFQKEITVCGYDLKENQNLEGFNDRSKKIILDDR